MAYILENKHTSSEGSLNFATYGCVKASTAE